MLSSVSIQGLAGGALPLHPLAVGSGYLGAALGAGMVLPQILRSLQDRSRAGVSPLSWSLTALGCFAWLLYGVRAGEPPQIPGNVIIVAGSVLIVLVVPATLRPGQRAACLFLAALPLVATAIWAPPEYLGFLALAVVMASSWPQTLQSLIRTDRAASAVSLGAWAMRAASQVAWLFYALVMGDVPVTVGAIVTLTSALLLLAAETRRRSAPQVTVDEPEPVAA